MRLTRVFATANVIGTSCCPDTQYLIMLVVRHLLMQRSSCIGRLQLDKCVSLFVQA